MTERGSSSPYTVEFETSVHKEALLPHTSPAEFLTQWHTDLQQGNLDWFAVDPDPTLLLGGVHVRPENTGLLVNIPALPSDLTPVISPAVGVSHCAGSDTLHGDLVLHLPTLSDMQRKDIAQVLATVHATPQDELTPTNTVRTLIPLSSAPYYPLQIVSRGKRDLLEALDLSEKDEYLGLFDPQVRKAMSTAVYILRDQGVLSQDSNTSTIYQTPYQKKFLAAGQSLIGIDEYADYIDETYLKEHIESALHEARIATDRSLQERLGIYYNNHPEVEELFSPYPDMDIKVNLATRCHEVSTDTIINFADFWQTMSRLVPQAGIPTVPPTAQRLADIDHIHNMTLVSSSGERLDLFLSRSSGICRDHAKNAR